MIKGWDIGVSGMCPGEKRKLKVCWHTGSPARLAVSAFMLVMTRESPASQIPSDLGYGDRGSPPKIPGGASLIFEVECLSINAPPGQSQTADL